MATTGFAETFLPSNCYIGRSFCYASSRTVGDGLVQPCRPGGRLSDRDSWPILGCCKGLEPDDEHGLIRQRDLI
jgi:hypothetical protein